MSRWGRPSWYTPAPKKAPPKRGIKMKKSGSTWWGQRWVEALERMSRGYSSRLARGRTYARAGRTHDLIIEGGKVSAKVTGSRSTPYKVTITLVRLSDGVWHQAIAAMAEKAQFSAELLAGQMPQEIDAAFEAAGASVFPVREADLSTSCSCPDWANPCKHVAATHYVLGEAFDRDPFLLFELRGRSKDQVLEALRAARADGGDLSANEKRGERADESSPVPTVTLARGKAADWDEPRDTLPSLKLSFAAPPLSGGLLRQLGTPSSWSSETSPADVLGPMIRAAAERARTMAMAEAETEQPVAPATAVRTEQPAVARRAATKKAAPKKAATKKTTSKAKQPQTKKKAAVGATKEAATKPASTKAKSKKTGKTRARGGTRRAR